MLNGEKTLKFFQANLSTVVVIPAFIGGLWQAIELMNISIPYIRFFSISQIVPDGLLILMFIVVALIPTIYSFIMDLGDEKQTPENEKLLLDEITLKRVVKRNKILFVLLMIFSFLMGVVVRKYLKIEEDVSILNIYFICALVVLFVLYQVIKTLNEINKSNPVNYIRGFRLLLFVTSISLTLTLCRAIHSNFLITNDLINIEKVNLLVKQKFPTASSEILYFNDKYLFYKLKFEKMKIKESSKHLEKIYIVELNEIFKEEEKKKL